MKRLLIIGLSAMSSILLSQSTLAYEVHTHQDISEQALQVSVLAPPSLGVLSPVLSSLQLKAFDNPLQKFPAADRTEKTIVGLLRHGADQEDNLPGSRFVHHFYDPAYQRPLTISANEVQATSALYGAPFLPTQNSFDWTLEDRQDLGVAQSFSFKDARRYFFEALSGTGFSGNSAVVRMQSFGLTFQTLGHVIHHIQDMAQPQHTKDEAHPTITNPRTDELIYAPGGLYEHYTDEEEVRQNLPFLGYEPVFSPASNGDHTTFSTPRKLWETGDGKGLAEFTNFNFITHGSNFIGSLDQPQANSVYRNPQPIAFGEETVIDLQLAPHAGLDQSPLDGKMYFIKAAVADAYRPSEARINNLASAFSLYDDDLERWNLHIECPSGFPDNPSAICTQRAVFTVNRFTMSAAHEFLIPRAVGYSAGLINYFFRGAGKIDLLPNPQDPNGYVIQNNNEEPLIGTFYLFYDDQSDKRWLRQTWVINSGIPAHRQVAVAGFSLPNDPNRPPKTPGQYMLVFKGQMGQEGDDPSVSNLNPNFAVAANLVNIGNGGRIVTSGGDARGFALPGNGGGVTITTGATLTTAPPATQALEVNAADTVTLASNQIAHYSHITIKGTLKLSGDVTLSADGPVIIAGTVEARSAANPRDGANLIIESPSPIIVSGRIDTSGHNADLVGQGNQEGGRGGNITIRTASTNAFVVPTIITRGGDASFIYPRDPVQQNWTGGHGGNITITVQGTTPGVALQFSGERLPDSAVDPLPEQQGVHELPTRTTFHRGLLTTGGYGGEFGGPDGIKEAGARGGNGGDISIICQQPAQVQFAETDLFTGGNIDVLLQYETVVVFTKGERPRFPILVQRTGSMGGRGSYGGTVINGGDGGPGGAAGAITVSSTCTLTPAPVTFANPPRVAPLFDGVDPRGGTSSRLSIMEAFDAANTRLYTLQAFGGGGGIPGGSAFTLARCSSDGSACFVEDGAGACPVLPNGSTQICLPVPDIEPSPGNYGPRGADGPVSCAVLGFAPPSPALEGLLCQ